MTDSDALEGLRGLHQDLIALGESRLPNIERLWAELEARIDEFRRLLDKPPKSDASRRTLQTGPLLFLSGTTERLLNICAIHRNHTN